MCEVDVFASFLAAQAVCFPKAASRARGAGSVMDRGPSFVHGRPAIASRVLEIATSPGPLVIIGLLILQ